MSPSRQVVFNAPTQCPKCSANGWAQLHRNHRGTTIALEWQCDNCKHRWPVMLDQLAGQPESATSTPSDRESELLRLIGSLREANEDLRASALRWRQLYDSAIGHDGEHDPAQERPSKDTTH